MKNLMVFAPINPCKNGYTTIHERTQPFYGINKKYQAMLPLHGEGVIMTLTLPLDHYTQIDKYNSKYRVMLPLQHQ